MRVGTRTVKSNLHRCERLSFESPIGFNVFDVERYINTAELPQLFLSILFFCRVIIKKNVRYNALFENEKKIHSSPRRLSYDICTDMADVHTF